MNKKNFEKYKGEMERRVSQLEETVSYISQNGEFNVSFVNKSEEYKTTTCYAKYVYDGVVQTALIETYPYSSVKLHKCTENNRDYFIVTSSGITYKVDKKTKKCVCISDGGKNGV